MYEAIFYYLKRQKNPRIRMFGRFLHLFDDLELDELDTYINTI